MMALVKLVFNVIILHLITASSHFNLDLTDWTNGSEHLNGLQHDCLHVFSNNEHRVNARQIISYCLTEWSPQWRIEENKFDQKFTFADLYKENITSEQLYDWSAPIDVIERYQSYLDQLSISNDLLSMKSQVFYNCTSPRFGPSCQYSLDISGRYPPSLNDIIYAFHLNHYNPTSLTCYTHLTCNRGSRSRCLDWTEICDDHIDCLNDAVDEKQCWQLYVNECQEDEFRCRNGQCISKIFLDDHSFGLECLDQSDKRTVSRQLDRLASEEPIFFSEDIPCSVRSSVQGITVTSSCVPKRNYLLKGMMLLDTPNSTTDECWLAFKCKYGMLSVVDSLCRNISESKTFVQVINDTCFQHLILPAGGIVYSHIYLAYQKESILISNALPEPQYICYNDRLCGGFYSNRTLLFIDKMTCRRPEDFPLTYDGSVSARGLDFYTTYLYKVLSQCNTIIYNDSTICSSSFMYQCINSSKCISRHRLCDGITDCDYRDDEECTLTSSICSMTGPDMLFKCTSSHKCISIDRVGDRRCDCGDDEYDLCDDEVQDTERYVKYLPFQIICDGFTELIPVTIDGRNETDETECEHWPCNNNYTRCNNLWNCFNGADEVDCRPSSCSSRHHACVSANTSRLTCLPIEQANNGVIDCAGATDEPRYCRSNTHVQSEQNFYCKNDAIQYCMSSKKACSDGEELCMQNSSMDSSMREFFCSLTHDTRKSPYQNFLLGDIALPSQFSLDQDRSTSLTPSSNIPMPWHNQDMQCCHRGLPLRIWLTHTTNTSTEACLCPPSFYGDTCQYQNQRVSLTARFRTFSESRRTLFTILASLIDESEERTTHSYHQFTYYYYQHCSMKFNIYLLYSTRPRHPEKNYSVHIDVYEKRSLVYRGSFLIPIQFLFLPVNRIATVLNIPPANDHRAVSCSNQLCKYGQCRRYIDDTKGSTFCQCDRQWSGKYCTIPHTCDCSLDSLCMGVSASNRSICVCPMNRWGSRCLLRNNACRSYQNEPCLNGGQCLPDDGQLIRSEKFICICPKGFTGHRCENSDNKITLFFDKDINLPQAIAFHFVQINIYGASVFGSIYKTIPINGKTIVVHWSHPFHVALARVFQSFYLIVPPQSGDTSANITRTITLSDRCDHIREVWNEKIAHMHLLRRMKYYHLPCRNHSPPLSCFYDDTSFCFCDHFGQERMANCFKFNSTTKHTCFGRNACENGAECLQDRPHCPQTSTCVCPRCSYGIRCQFSSSLFSLSLDAILGYHIQPHIDMIHQPSIVQFSLALTIIMSVGGLINGLVSLLTFKNKASRELGCGLYLLGSSITTIFSMIMFALKFSILIFTQIMPITNRSFLHSQCLSIDFLLRFSLNMDQWLNACVAMERATTAVKQTSFNKRKSRQMAIYIIVILLITNISTSVHDPLYRRLIDDNEGDDDDENENRIWCIVTYPPHMQAFNLVTNIVHFCVPFAINLISALIIIVRTTRQQTKVQTRRKYRKLLREQLLKHKHILIAPIILVLLALPRLIISLVSGCSKSVHESWVFLIGYFISFTPPMVTSVVFILPSNLYKKEFQKSIKQIQNTIGFGGLRTVR